MTKIVLRLLVGRATTPLEIQTSFWSVGTCLWRAPHRSWSDGLSDQVRGEAWISKRIQQTVGTLCVLLNGHRLHDIVIRILHDSECLGNMHIFKRWKIVVCDGNSILALDEKVCVTSWMLEVMAGCSYYEGELFQRSELKCIFTTTWKKKHAAQLKLMHEISDKGREQYLLK